MLLASYADRISIVSRAVGFGWLLHAARRVACGFGGFVLIVQEPGAAFTGAAHDLPVGGADRGREAFARAGACGGGAGR